MLRGGPERNFLWSSRYRYSRFVEPGLEWQSKLGKTSEDKSYDEQEHYVGPALYGQLVPGVKYEAAYLFGASDASADSAARLHLEYEIAF